MSNHAAMAATLMDESDRQWEPGSDIEAAYLNEALVHATLAVAAELRTANLIAALAVGAYLTPRHEHQVRDEIAGRLGVTTP